MQYLKKGRYFLPPTKEIQEIPAHCVIRPDQDRERCSCLFGFPYKLLRSIDDPPRCTDCVILGNIGWDTGYERLRAYLENRSRESLDDVPFGEINHFLPGLVEEVGWGRESSPTAGWGHSPGSVGGWGRSLSPSGGGGWGSGRGAAANAPFTGAQVAGGNEEGHTTRGMNGVIGSPGNYSSD